MKLLILSLLISLSVSAQDSFRKDSIMFNTEHNLIYKIYNANEDFVLLSGGAETLSDAESNLVRLKVPVEVFDKQFTDLIPTTKPTVNEEVAEKYFYYIIVRLNIIEKVRKEIKRLNVKI